MKYDLRVRSRRTKLAIGAFAIGILVRVAAAASSPALGQPLAGLTPAPTGTPVGHGNPSSAPSGTPGFGVVTPAPLHTPVPTPVSGGTPAPLNTPVIGQLRVTFRFDPNDGGGALRCNGTTVPSQPQPVTCPFDGSGKLTIRRASWSG